MIVLSRSHGVVNFGKARHPLTTLNCHFALFVNTLLTHSIHSAYSPPEFRINDVGTAIAQTSWTRIWAALRVHVTDSRQQDWLLHCRYPSQFTRLSLNTCTQLYPQYVHVIDSRDKTTPSMSITVLSPTHCLPYVRQVPLDKRCTPIYSSASFLSDALSTFSQVPWKMSLAPKYVYTDYVVPVSYTHLTLPTIYSV